MNNFKYQLNNLIIKDKQITFFDFITPHEMLVSSWLCFILDPTKNGLINGTYPIELILNTINEKLSEKIKGLNFESIKTEVVNFDKKRMDILIKFDGLWIVIENKINSFDGGSTNYYYKEIEKIKQNNEVVYLYLKPNYNKSKPKNTNFTTLTYCDLINALKCINETNYIDKEKYKFKYLNEFIKSGERFMKNEDIEINEDIVFYVNNLNKINALKNNYEVQNKNLQSKIETGILSVLGDTYFKHTGINNGNLYIQFFKNNWYNNDYHKGIHFEIIFNSINLLCKGTVQAIIALHIENKTPNIKKQKLNLAISKEYTDIEIMCNFSDYEKISKSIDELKNIILKLKENYEKIIDNL